MKPTNEEALRMAMKEELSERMYQRIVDLADEIQNPSEYE